DATVYDAAGKWVFPGFIDLHVHAGGGADTMDASLDALKTMTALHGAHGTTGIVATTMTAPCDEILAAAESVREAMEGSREAGWAAGRMDAALVAMKAMTALHGALGTTGSVATTLPAPFDEILAAPESVREAMERSREAGWGGARILGMHLEGPYLNPKQAG